MASDELSYSCTRITKSKHWEMRSNKITSHKKGQIHGGLHDLPSSVFEALEGVK